MLNTNIGLEKPQLESSINILNTVLADEFMLYTKVRKAHWNVSGIHFRDHHKLYLDMYEELDIIVDDVAERIRSLGGNAVSTLGEFVKNSRLVENPGEYPNSLDLLKNLLAEYETLIREIRSDVDECADKNHDAGTADFLTGVMEKHEKVAWMLRSLLS